MISCEEISSLSSFLIDSSASTTQAYFVFVSSNWCGRFSLYGQRRSLQGIAAGIGSSNVLRAFLHDILEFLTIRINYVNTTQSPGIAVLWFLDCPLLLRFAFRRIGHIFPNLWPQSVWSGGRLFSCQFPPGPCMSIRWFFIQYSESYETCPCIWQFSISINVPIVIDVLLQHYIQGCICSPGHVDTVQWNGKWFFSWHVQIDTGFHVMTVNEIAWHGPEIIPGFTIMPRWVLKWGWRRSVWFFSKISLFHSSFWVLPGWGGCSQTLISSTDFDCSLCEWEYKLFTTHWR